MWCLLNPRFRDVELLRHLLEGGVGKKGNRFHHTLRREVEGDKKDVKRKRGTERGMVRGREGQKDVW